MPGSGLLADAARLRREVASACEGLVTRSPTDAAAGSSPTAAIRERLSDGALDTLAGRLEANALRLVDENFPGRS